MLEYAVDHYTDLGVQFPPHTPASLFWYQRPSICCVKHDLELALSALELTGFELLGQNANNNRF